MINMGGHIVYAAPQEKKTIRRPLTEAWDLICEKLSHHIGNVQVTGSSVACDLGPKQVIFSVNSTNQKYFVLYILYTLLDYQL